MRHCLVCNEPIRTGTKYCFRHRFGFGAGLNGVKEREMKRLRRGGRNLMLSSICIFGLGISYNSVLPNYSNVAGFEMYFGYLVIAFAMLLGYLAFKKYQKATQIYQNNFE